MHNKAIPIHNMLLHIFCFPFVATTNEFLKNSIFIEYQVENKPLIFQKCTGSLLKGKKGP